MPVVNVNLSVDDETYAGIMSGALELCGLVKNVDNKRVVKHLHLLGDAAKEGAVKTLGTINKHKKEVLIIGGGLMVGGAIVGVIGYVANKGKRIRQAQFAEALQAYLDAAKSGELTIETLDRLIASLEMITSENPLKPVDIKISSKQFCDLINAVFDYTRRLAEANHIDAKVINRPQEPNTKDLFDLQYYLNMQRTIFKQAA